MCCDLKIARAAVYVSMRATRGQLLCIRCRARAAAKLFLNWLIASCVGRIFINQLDS